MTGGVADTTPSRLIVPRTTKTIHAGSGEAEVAHGFGSQVAQTGSGLDQDAGKGQLAQPAGDHAIGTLGTDHAADQPEALPPRMFDRVEFAGEQEAIDGVKPAD